MIEIRFQSSDRAIPAPMGAAQLDKFWKADFDYWRPVVQSVKLD